MRKCTLPILFLKASQYKYTVIANALLITRYFRELACFLFFRRIKKFQLFVLAEGQVVYSGAPKDLNKFFKDASDDPTFPDIQIGS